VQHCDRGDFSDGEFSNPRLIRVAKAKRFIRWAFRSKSGKRVDFAPNPNEDGRFYGHRF
jgi:hypothetical protein